MQQFEHISIIGTIPDVTTIIDKVVRKVHDTFKDEWQFRGHHYGNDEHGPILAADLIVSTTQAENICKYKLSQFAESNNFRISFKKINHNNLSMIKKITQE